MSSVYKKALQGFFLKVHPDFFASQAKLQRVNEASIAQLNELLSWAKDVKTGGTFRPPPSTSISLSFYSQGQLETQQQSTTSSEPDIQATFELPPNFTATDANRSVVERATNKFLRDLLRKARCIDGATEAMSVAEDVAHQKEEVKPLRRRQKHQRKVKASKSLLDEAAEAMVESWNITAAPTIEELIEADQILLSRSLSPLQTAMALQTLKTHLGEMMYERWQGMPLVISDRFSVAITNSTNEEVAAEETGGGTTISGTFSVPWDFTMPQFYAFLQQNDHVLQQQRANVESMASAVETIVTDVCQALEVDDVLISCSHRDAVSCLKLLKANVARLLAANVTRVTLEIGRRFALRSNGVVVVPADLQPMQMAAWLRAVSPRMPQQQKLYILGKQMLEATMWHLKEFREIVEPAGVDAFENDNTYHERLMWSKELYRVAGTLAQWDWSEFTFTIGPIDINWEKKWITLPFNFDGAALVRYVEGVHEEAKQKKRDEQLVETAQQREDDERRALERGSPASLEEELAKEFPEVSTAAVGVPHEAGQGAQSSQDAAMAASVSRYQSPKSWSSSAITGQKPERVADKRQELAGALPHMSEYMTSSATSVDPLSVERPLHHTVTFASDDEAKDQMLWEGFYDDAYVDQVPASDVEDVQHAYFATNRWHREKAANQMIEELQGKYGKTSKRFGHIKMGDLMGINNPREKPKGFPILAPGTAGARK